MLYWSCHFNIITTETVKDLIRLTPAYPEGPNIKDDQFTPIHAASYAGNEEKLQVLLDDYKARQA